MVAPRVILVTGVSRDLGARFARTLAADDDLIVVGVDLIPPRHDLGQARFVRADIRNPVIAKVIAGHGVDTVVHLGMVASPGSAGGRSAMKELNVIGTMQLLAACQKAESFRKLVVQSSVSVYGASPRDPAKFTEEMSPRAQPRTGFGKDSIEIESYVQGLARRRPDVVVSTLRLASLMGSGADSHIARYLSLAVVPRVLGFDARLQFLHPSDAIAALTLVTTGDVPGTFNVAAPDIVTLSQALRKLGRPTIGVPQSAAPVVASLVRQARLVDFSADQIDALTYGRAVDGSRFFEATGFVPTYSSMAAFEEFAAASAPGLLDVDRIGSLVGTVGLLVGGVLVPDADIIDFSSGEHRPRPSAAPEPEAEEATAPGLSFGGLLSGAASMLQDAMSGELGDYVRARLTGDYEVDEFGFDPDFTTTIFLPVMRQLTQSWFRVEVRGAENLPVDGSALLVCNHAGTMPLDGLVLHTVVFDQISRHVRSLGADLIFQTPFSHDFARKIGTTLACQEDAERLLASEQLVSVFPEGFKGLGKPYADRYKLQRFGRGGFVSAAVRAQVPIIPVSIVGSEEIYPLIARAPGLARMLGVPYVPVTPLFPWLGPLGMVPLPSKWIIQFGDAIATDELPLGAAEDPMVVLTVTDQVRETIQQTLYTLLMQRRSAFF